MFSGFTGSGSELRTPDSNNIQNLYSTLSLTVRKFY